MTEARLPALQAFIFGNREGYFDEVDELVSQGGMLQTVLLSFRANLSAAISVGSIPFELAYNTVLDQDFRRFLTAARIRALKVGSPGEPIGEEAEHTALQTAQRQLREAVADNEANKEQARRTLELLDQQLKNPEFSASAQELLRQILVMSWAAFEVLINDALRALINRKPQLIGALARSKAYKDYFSERRLLEALEENDFDLSSRMGDYFCDLVRLDSLEKIRAAVEVCFNDAALERDFKNDKLWHLSQQRHLIVHRRGVVDRKYIEQTGDTAKLGEHLSFTSDYVDDCLNWVKGLGCTFYRVAMQKVTD